MWCHSKKEMLEYLGKDGKDVRYIDRAIMSGKIIERRCMYILASEYIKELEGKGKENLNNNGDRIEHEVVDKNDIIIEYQGKIKELESDLEYLNGEYSKLEKDILRYQEAIRQSYLYIKNTLKGKVNRPTYKEIIKLGGDLPGEDNQ